MEPKRVFFSGQGLNLREVMTTGSSLTIDHDFDLEDDELDSPPLTRKTIAGVYRVSDVENNVSFDELSAQMRNVDEHGYVKKKILQSGGGAVISEECTVIMEYAGFWEEEVVPFDFTDNHKNLACCMNDSGLLPGLHTAVLSMQPGEISQFLLSYHVMYGEKGVLKRIKPKADCMFVIRIISSFIDHNGEYAKSEKKTFRIVSKEAKSHFMLGYNMYKANDLPATTRHFKRAAQMLLWCRLADEKEEMKQQSLLKKLFYNMAVCYNKQKLPLKACVCCNEYNRIENICRRGNEKVLFQHAIAMRMIGEFDRAEKYLRKALKSSPDDVAMLTELEILESRRQFYEQSDMLLEQMAALSITEDFKVEVDKVLKELFEDEEIVQLKLPAGLSQSEIEYVKVKTDMYGFELNNLTVVKISNNNSQSDAVAGNSSDQTNGE